MGTPVNVQSTSSKLLLMRRLNMFNENCARTPSPSVPPLRGGRKLKPTQALFQIRHGSRKRVMQAWQFDTRLPALKGRKEFMKNLQFTDTRLEPA